MSDKNLQSYVIKEPFHEEGDEILFAGNEGGVIAFKRSEVAVEEGRVIIGPDVRPRLAVQPDTPPGGEKEPVTGLYCICFGETCYTYQCSDNKYLGPCGSNCAYWGCSSKS